LSGSCGRPGSDDGNFWKRLAHKISKPRWGFIFLAFPLPSVLGGLPPAITRPNRSQEHLPYQPARGLTIEELGDRAHTMSTSKRISWPAPSCSSSSAWTGHTGLRILELSMSTTPSSLFPIRARQFRCSTQTLRCVQRGHHSTG